ncbi:transaldolase [Limimaricola variabilis]|uniref:Transaldolase n=1 Tax=Limimaricola variabilis TaxID=1492771 RepID=A0ABR6HR69_9RHOB|nr:transaldolase family protein [Limimaricola variabilis]MBB3713049.1 transaldolase [Limimaricola variabilis]
MLTEVDACLSFDTAGSVVRAHEIITDYAARSMPQDRALIKLAATWEGICAADILQAKGIDCNLTLLFLLVRAAACADAGVYLISPFVGRITDWHWKADSVDGYASDVDPGVRSVRRIFDYYNSSGIGTIVMGASFRNVAQIKALAGYDRLTIAPALLCELSQDTSELPHALRQEQVVEMEVREVGEARFRGEIKVDAMATENLAEGLRNFDADHRG